MRRILTYLCLCGVLAAQKPEELTGVFDEYLAAVKAKDFRKVTALYRGAMKQEILSEYESATDQGGFLEALSEAAPDSYEGATVTRTGDGKILLRLIARKSVPPEMRKEQNLPPVVQLQVEVEFAREGGLWKMGAPVSRPLAAVEPRPLKDLHMGRRADYDEDSTTEVSGPILRAEKQSTGTVYLIRVLDDEVAVFVPAHLAQSAFTKGKVLVVQGASHPEDTQKLWAEKARVRE
ncbi:MAG: hypothetical protein JJE04_06070 [Acidobacteriia bacterium]|nr:hypothetical protein [Terriglobia bacterium]